MIVAAGLIRDRRRVEPEVADHFDSDPASHRREETVL